VRQETEKQTKELLKTMFGLASDKTQDTLSKPVDENAVVNDLSTLVKRKAKETVKDDAASKKPKNE
jgi:HAT1-interacting factor 1